MKSLLKSYKLYLLGVIILSVYLGTGGNFVRKHIDSEFLSTSLNKTYLLHFFYYHISKLELWFRAEFLNVNSIMNLKRFMSLHRTDAFALYLGAFVFSSIGLLGTYNTGKNLFDKKTGLIAALFLSTSLMWASYLHYPTVDLPLTAFCVFSFSEMLSLAKTKEQLTKLDLIYLGLLVGISLSFKYAAAFLLIPFIVLFFKKSKLKNSIFNIISLSLIAWIIFVLNMGNKFEKLKRIVDFEMHALYKSGYIGFENEAGHTFIYHLKSTLFTEYGLILSLLTFLGIFFSYKKLERKFFWACLSFPLVVYLVMGSMLLEAPRYIMPALPFCALYSAHAIKALTDTFSKKFNLSTKFQYSLLILISILLIGPNIFTVYKHNQILKTDHYSYKLQSIFNKLKSKHKVLNNPLKYTLPAGFRNISSKTKKKENLLSCNKESIDFSKKFFYPHNNNLLMLDSFLSDRFVYDWHFKCPDKNRRAFSNYENLELFIFTPFTLDKTQVPFSHQSYFSPKPPDLWYRKRQGPYIEVFTKDKDLADKFEILIKEAKIDYQRTKAKDSFYLQNIQGFTPDDK